MKKFIQCCLLILLGIVFFAVGSESYAAEKPVTVNRFLLQLYSDKKEEAIPIKNASVKIMYYDADGKRHTVGEGISSDDNGEIKNVTVNMPEEIKCIYFQFGMTNSEVGSLVSSKGNIYHPIVSTTIPENRQIDHTDIRFIMNLGNEATKEFNYQLFIFWDLYQELVKEMKDNVQTALDAFPELKKDFNFSFEPIPVLYEPNYMYNGKNGAFFKSKSEGIGVIKKGTPFIHIPHPESLSAKTRAEQKENLSVNLSHEWAHWTMYQALGSLDGGGYSSHSGYNMNVKTSYKEGWALFHANRYPYGYYWNWRLDTSMQTSETVYEKGRLEKCYGKSTNWTVNSVLRDIFDMEAINYDKEAINYDKEATNKEPEDQYDIAKDWKPDVAVMGDEYRQSLSTGLMFIAMVNSKATTLEEYVTYMKDNGFIKDKIRFDIILVLNGVDHLGRFILDKDGNRITY